MNFERFIKEYADVPVIDSRTFSMYESSDDLRRQVTRWVKRGKLIPLKRGLYIFNDQYRKKKADPLFIANLLVHPSYVSLTYALWHYGLIPEQVSVITSVTTKKTRTFDNETGTHEYRSIKKAAFKGYKRLRKGDHNIFIAAPEKALVDYFYYYSGKGADAEYFESLRLQNLDRLDLHDINSYKGVYNKRVDKVITAFSAYCKDYERRFRSL